MAGYSGVSQRARQLASQKEEEGKETEKVEKGRKGEGEVFLKEKVKGRQEWGEEDKREKKGKTRVDGPSQEKSYSWTGPNEFHIRNISSVQKPKIDGVVRKELR